jgi:hypothetical protein
MSAHQSFKNRLAIYKALKIDPNAPHARYAVEPFRIVEHQGVWIGGAVGFAPRWTYDGWTPTGEVILWNPRTGVVQLLDDDGPTLVKPADVSKRLTVYADGFAFFRAWADRRAAQSEAICLAAMSNRNTFAEPRDGGIPGALAIGDLNGIQWRETNASVLVAGPGIDAKQLNRAIIRSARLPRVESLAA